MRYILLINLNVGTDIGNNTILLYIITLYFNYI